MPAGVEVKEPLLVALKFVAPPKSWQPFAMRLPNGTFSKPHKISSTVKVAKQYSHRLTSSSDSSCVLNGEAYETWFRA